MALPIAAAVKTLATRVAQSETARTLATEAGKTIATAATDKLTQKVLQRLDGNGPAGRAGTPSASDMPMPPRGNKLSMLSARKAQSPDMGPDVEVDPRAPRA
ncbi:hypothetical protein [Piscinibacter gummiphilus]|uniref:Uncharacterized protein n=1 Tax=Piscinibacter gummiphilus TaxID=946333 RepID=A0A1W6L9B3_9BURK|nr:hypothetical protein [Piscinibacter gummiphilus]ARN20767.1 hypothetical protein A4W93_13155 [Piscinibacter gummiphilus]ATU65443.1 hypothetical protein CPZ87_13235 [Piscinibacter gummiphilus]GLS94597.1 hypothetical protein GCM10007918_18890 [Piscinibacter gummiphilus]